MTVTLSKNACPFWVTVTLSKNACPFWVCPFWVPAEMRVLFGRRGGGLTEVVDEEALPFFDVLAHGLARIFGGATFEGV